MAEERASAGTDTTPSVLTINGRPVQNATLLSTVLSEAVLRSTATGVFIDLTCQMRNAEQRPPAVPCGPLPFVPTPGMDDDSV